MKTKVTKPKAVLISDIHYNVHTLALADAAMRQAIAKANELQVPLIVAGDLHDTKANLRGECINAMLETFKLCNQKPYILVGNHDRINEKSFEHSLNFLQACANIIDGADRIKDGPYLIAYQHNPDICRAILKACNTGAVVIMHQGLSGSNMGDYIQDKSAITPEDVAGMRVISGHYHTRQTIPLPKGGIWNYIGNPYTLGFGEANDPPKGYQILMEDRALEFVPTSLRRHVVYNFPQPAVGGAALSCSSEDLLWVKVSGTKEYLANYNKRVINEVLNISFPYRLDLIPIETLADTQIEHKDTQKQEDVLDSLIDSMANTSTERKERLKQTWKDLCE